MDDLLGHCHQGRDEWQAEEQGADGHGLWGSIAQLSGTRAVQGVHVMGATTLDATLIVQILIPDIATGTHDTNLAVH